MANELKIPHVILIKLACLICRLVNQYFMNLSQKTASARLFSLFTGKYILTFALLINKTRLKTMLN